jgi:two-component system cell cycle response regulator
MHPRALGILTEMTQQLLDDEASRSAALQHVTDTALRLIDADHASLRLCGAGGRLEIGARSGVGAELPALPFDKGQGVLGWVAQTGQPARVGDSLREPRFVDRRERGFAVGSVISVPVCSGGNTLGVLSVSSPVRDAFTDADEAMALLLAGAAAQALRTAELRQLSLTDSQTLAYNRRYLLPRLCQEMERALRRAEPLSLLLIDLDHFKRVNDCHGHAAGDRVLRSFADAVRACVRAVDVMVRRGGEEFVLIMPSTAEHQAVAVAERLRGQLESQPLHAGEGLALRQTVSIGVAEWDCVQSAEVLEERADRAMYEAKQRGRNRVMVACAESAERADFEALSPMTR